jgi:Biotin synthase and related enzymes
MSGAESKTIGELYRLPDEDLFPRAAAAGAEKPRAYWSPDVLTGRCATQPHCLHCKWESFKHDRPEFGALHTRDELARRGEAALAAGATHLLAPSGWLGYEVPDSLCEAVRFLKERFSVPVYGLCGSVSRDSLRRLKDAGMDGYQCGLESPDPAVYRSFRPGGDSLEDRVRTLRDAKSLGLSTWSGFLLAFGLTDEAALAGLTLLRELDTDWVAVQPFVPYPHTVLQAADPTNPYRWARMMAAARLWFPPETQLVATENSGAYANFLPLTGANAFFLFPRRD